MSCGIYKITNLINNKVYIGQSIDIEKRLKKHKYSYDNFHIHRAIQKYGKDNFSYEIIEECSQDALDEKEKYWITYYNSLEPNGYNMVPGGSNGTGLAKGIPIKQYDLKGNFIKEYPSANQAARELDICASLINDCCNGKMKHYKCFQWRFINSDLPIQNLGDSEQIKYQNKSVEQYDLKGNFIKKYSSITEAGQELNISKGSICNCCQGKRKQANGFQWRYENSKLPIKNIEKEIKKKAVIQLTLTEEYINEFSSVAEASKQTGTSKSCISACCNGQRKTSNGFKWKFK